MRRFLAVLFLAAALPGAALGQKRDPQVDAVVEKMMAAYKAAGSLHIVAAAKAKGAAAGLLSSGPQRIAMKLQRPNKLYFDYSGIEHSKPVKKLIVCDGASIWRWDSGTNRYTKGKAPATLTNLPGMTDDLPELDIIFRGKDPLNNFEMGMSGAALKIGKPVKLGNLAADTVEAEMKAPPMTMTFRLLVGQQDHFVHGMQVVMTGKNPSNNQDMSGTVDIVYEHAEAGVAFTAAEFAFVPPAGAKLATPKPAGK